MQAQGFHFLPARSLPFPLTFAMSILHRPPSKGHVHKIRRLLSASLRYSDGSFTAYMVRAAACEGGYDITIKKRCRNRNRKRGRCVLAQKAELFPGPAGKAGKPQRGFCPASSITYNIRGRGSPDGLYTRPCRRLPHLPTGRKAGSPYLPSTCAIWNSYSSTSLDMPKASSMS